MTTSASAMIRRPDAITVHRRATVPAVLKSCALDYSGFHCIPKRFDFRSGTAGHPFRLALFAVGDCVEHEFDASGNAKLVENAQQIFLNSGLAQPQLMADLAIAEPIGYQPYHLFLAWGQQ